MSVVPAASIAIAARSRRGSCAVTTPSNALPSHSTMVARSVCATCAFVTMSPSADQMMPEPAPVPRVRTSTTLRRSAAESSELTA
jgi:hypothetical protein